MEHDEQQLSWAQQLEWADGFLQTDPTAARDAYREVVSALEHALRHARLVDPAAQAELAPLLCEARLGLARAERESELFCEEAEIREHDFHARELAAVRRPLRELRRPFPGVNPING